MPKLPLKEEFALHEFSVRYRAALAKEAKLSAEAMKGIREAVRDQYERERQGDPGMGIEAPAIEAPKIESPAIGESKIEAPKIEAPEIKGPKIEPPRPAKQRDLEGPEPEI